MKNFIHGKLIYGHSLRALVLYAADWQLKVTIAWHWSFYSVVLCLSLFFTLCCALLVDVKPSNMLLDELGCVKLCDFGISGRLVDSKAKTRGAGCAAYMSVSYLLKTQFWPNLCQCQSAGVFWALFSLASYTVNIVLFFIALCSVARENWSTRPHESRLWCQSRCLESGNFPGKDLNNHV